MKKLRLLARNAVVLTPINSPGGRLHGSYPETAFEDVIEATDDALGRLTRYPDKWVLAASVSRCCTEVELNTVPEEIESLAMQKVGHCTPSVVGELSPLLRQSVLRLKVFVFVEICVRRVQHLMEFFFR